ncbi:hypothetical protein ACTHSI_03620, partial [Neisseria sp. P0001.S004]
MHPPHQYDNILVNMIATGLSVPTQSGVGIAAATVSPMISGARLVNNPSCKGCLISADGTRLYRPPTTKKTLQHILIQQERKRILLFETQIQE